jgi:hypothetical protein
MSETKESKRLIKGFIIGISFSASIGGCGSLVGKQIFVDKLLSFFVLFKL